MPSPITHIDTCCAPVRYRVRGMISNNVYVIEDGAGACIVVDPEGGLEAIEEMLEGAPVSAIFITHNHADHTGSLRELQQATGAPVYASAIDAAGIENPPKNQFGLHADPCPVDVRLNDGDEIHIGETVWRFMLTPGHTPGSGCYYLAPEKSAQDHGAPMLLSGDTLFHGTIGRTDFEGGSMEDMRASLRKLGTLSDETIVLPGHDALTSIGTERWRVIDFLGNGGLV